MASTDFLHGIEVVNIDDGVRPIRTVRSAVIGLVGTAGKGAVNTPTLVTSRSEGVTKFGQRNDADGFTIPQALDAIFDQCGATVVVVNVCDPEEETATIADEVVSFDARTQKAALAHGFVSEVAIATAMKVKRKLSDIAAGVIEFRPYSASANGINKSDLQDTARMTIGAVKNAAGTTTYTITTDYTVSYTGGVRKITRVSNGAIPQGAELEITFTLDAVTDGVDYSLDADNGIITRLVGTTAIPKGATLTVDYDHVTASSITATDVVGGAAEDGGYTGVHALLAAQSTVFLTPRILLAPGFTGDKPDANTANPVVAELLGIAERMRAIVLADGPNTTDEDAVAYRQDWGSERVYVLDPKVKKLKSDDTYGLFPYSPCMAGVIARTDEEVGFWQSPSNKEIFGIVGLGRPIEFALGDKNSRANYLNENEVCTIIHEKGYRTWGNRTCALDQKYAFLSVVRTNDMVAESIKQAHLWAVDNNINKGFVEAVVDGVKAYLRYLQNLGAILGGDAWVDPKLNTPEVIQSGQLFIDYDFTPPYPAERITFRAHLVNNYVVNIFD